MNDENAAKIDIEVAFATPASQFLASVSVAAGATLDDAIKASALEITFPQYCFDDFATGIWGHGAERGQMLKEGDRVEVYRALECDPMEARRLRALGSIPGRGESR